MTIRFYHALYNYGAMPFLRLGLALAKMFSAKVAERERAVEESLRALEQLAQGKKRLWFHAASMGEFEQAKPVIEAVKEVMPELSIVVSFFSPSGYRNQKNYAFADAVVYLPFDTPTKVHDFLRRVQPSAAIFVRYDVWWNYLYQCKVSGIPVYLINATFPSSSFARVYPLRAFVRALFSLCSSIISNGKEQAQLFEHYTKHPKIIAATDTRYDRISKAVAAAQQQPVLPRSSFGRDEIVLVVGSSWQADEELLFKTMQDNPTLAASLRLILVPHEPTEKTLQRIEALFGDVQRLSTVTAQPTHRHIVVDSIGKLLGLYATAHAAFVGGGFGAGVHSVSEAAGYGIPVACGPAVERNDDARTLATLGGVCVVTNSTECANWLEHCVASNNNRSVIGTINATFIGEHSGSTHRIVQILQHEV